MADLISRRVIAPKLCAWRTMQRKKNNRRVRAIDIACSQLIPVAAALAIATRNALTPFACLLSCLFLKSGSDHKTGTDRGLRHHGFDSTFDSTIPNFSSAPPASPAATGQTIMSSKKEGDAGRWFPLESNPELLNSYISKLGFDSSQFHFVDVFSTEAWALEMVPQPVAAVIMLYPISQPQEAHRSEENTNVIPKQQVSDKVWYMKQRIGNACGTIGILHALGNLSLTTEAGADGLIKKDSWLDRFYSCCPRSLGPTEKASILESDKEIESMHDAATADDANQTGRGELDDAVNTHFVALVNIDGGLYELDGRKEAPIHHGSTGQTSFLKDACVVVDTFMQRDPGELRFTIVALAANKQSR